MSDQMFDRLTVPPIGAAAKTQITADPMRGMITLRADLKEAKLAAALKKTIACGVPGQREILFTADHTGDHLGNHSGDHAKDQAVAWMSPDELLILCSAANAADLTAQLQQALSGCHHLVVDVSDARSLFALQGEAAAQLLMKGAPVDVTAMPMGEIRRSRIGQNAAAFWRVAGGFELVCFRSVSDYMADWLAEAASS